MTKTQILQEIRRIAEATGNVPPGKAKFAAETGIRESDWSGVYWARWSDALEEAGFAPNEFNKAFTDAHLLSRYAELAHELGRLPVAPELRLRARSDPSFPSHNTFQRFGRKRTLLQRVAEHCRHHALYPDVIRMCENFDDADSAPESKQGDSAAEGIGFVYLMKSGRFWKIGKSNSAGRREYELAIQLPEKLELVHAIRTDDPSGIEQYWHKRFAAKRRNGEWFALTAADVKAFKRRKFM